MDELVGTCVRCARKVYCTAGFLNGILLDNKKSYVLIVMIFYMH